MPTNNSKATQALKRKRGPSRKSDQQSLTPEPVEIKGRKRSERLKKSDELIRLNFSSFKNNLLMYTMMIMCICGVTNAFRFIQRDPMLWSKTDMVVPGGTDQVNQVNCVLNYRHLCNIGETNEMKVYQQNCIKLFNTSFIEPMEGFCDIIETNTNTPGMLIVKAGFGDWLMIGLQSVLLIFGIQDHNRLNQIESDMKASKEVLNKVMKTIEMNRLLIINMDLKLQSNLFPAAEIAYEMFKIGETIERSAERWKKGQTLDPKFFKAMNLTIDRQSRLKPEFMWPKLCQMDKKRQLVFIFTSLRTTSSEEVWKAIPFDLYEKS